jgi:hypothetical protein
MGSGEFGSNGSVYWAISYTENGSADHVDYDVKEHHKIGTGKPGGDHPGVFRITARFDSPGEAARWLKSASVVGKNVILDVPVRPFDQVKNGPGNQNDWEIRIDW